MITKFLYRTNNIKRLIKIGLFIIVSFIFYILSSQTKANSIEFDDAILNGFPTITGYISNAHFNYGGNDFYGTFFLLNPGYSGNTIALNGETKVCSRQIRGLYYNNQRGHRLRPLDQTTLNILKTLDTGYNNLTISGGWYTLCSGINPDEIYGQILHNRYTGTIFNMIAGVNYNFTTNSYTGGLSGTLKFFNNITGYFWDQRGGVSNFWGTGVPSLTQTGICTGVVSSGIYYNGTTSYSITQTRNGTSWTPTTGGIYTGSPISNSCNFNCINGYSWSGSISQCVQIIGPFCGDGILNIGSGEQCDYGDTNNGDGCNSYCQRETPSCTLTNNSPKYTGENVIFTGIASGRVAFDLLGFGDGTTGSRASNTTGITQATGHSYTISGNYTATLKVKNILSGNITNTCTSSVYISGNTSPICGNTIVETGEQCDYNNATNGSGCNTNCTRKTPSCTGLTITPTTGYAPLSVVFSGTKNSRANYTLNFGVGSSTGTFNLPLTNIYSSTGIFIYSFTGVNIYSGAFTCIQTGTITSLYSGTICRNGWTNQSGTCILSTTGNTTVTGTITSGTTFTIPGNITIYSSGNNFSGSYLQISGINSVGISYSNRDGILIPPTILTAGSCSASASTLISISSGLTNPTTLLEFQAGASGSTITSNQTGLYFTIKVKVNSGTIGNTYRIFRSVQCSAGREKLYIDELCILDSNKICEFRTNKLSYFNIVSNSFGGGTPMIVGTIPRLRNAQIDKAYMSNPFTIANFNDITLATVTKGMLYVNGDPIGASGYVQNGDELNIELYSSKKYDTTISSKITVGDISATFYITTIVEGDDNSVDLGNLQKIRIMSIFNLLLELYSDNTSKEEEFLYTLRSMLTDKLATLDENNDSYSTFEYLLSLIDARLLVSGIDESDHISPTCKEYQISFDEDEEAYYSPDFKKIQYFSTRESLTRYIDSKNPGDCRINKYGLNYIDTTNTDPDKHIAPNGKVYKIEENNGLYTSPDLSNTKYFDTIQGLRAYLNINNPATAIRNHEIDTSFSPINYIAPNGKIYKIYKTDKGYMSYKLLKIRYFTTLESIKSFINQNNRI